MKKSVCALLSILLLCGCTPQTPADVSTDVSQTVSETPVSYAAEAYRDRKLSSYALSTYLQHRDAKEIMAVVAANEFELLGIYELCLVPPQYLRENLDVFRIAKADAEALKLSESDIGSTALVDKKAAAVLCMLTRESLVCISAGPEYAVGVTEDGKRLLKLPYDGSETVELFNDPHGKIKTAEYFNDCVFFTAATDETHLGIYRIFNGQTDLLIGNLPLDITKFTVISNGEVAWTERLSDADENARTYWETPLGNGKSLKETVGTPNGCAQYDELSDDLKSTCAAWLEPWLFREKGIFTIQYRYYNAPQNQLLSLYSYSSWETFPDLYYPDKTVRDASLRSSWRVWWLDEYYYRNDTVKS